jgi:acetyltransferase-like isoleucine patch superfamily enzyme
MDLGDHAEIDAFTVITTALTLGCYASIGPHCLILGEGGGRLVMKDFSSLSAGCRIVCSGEDYTGEGLTGAAIPLQYRVVKMSTVTLERFAFLAVNVTVFPGVTIGEGAAVAAGAAVDMDLEPWGIYAGSPVRRIGWRRQERILANAKELLRSGVSCERDRGA